MFWYILHAAERDVNVVLINHYIIWTSGQSYLTEAIMTDVPIYPTLQKRMLTTSQSITTLSEPVGRLFNRSDNDRWSDSCLWYDRRNHSWMSSPNSSYFIHTQSPGWTPCNKPSYYPIQNSPCSSPMLHYINNVELGINMVNSSR